MENSKARLLTGKRNIF